ncbi:3-hydroxybutyrate dehydrogenase [Flexivirga alba]|uniref:3-hydroxybutyrate dehydrogenase n=1 Tax=Flexivirga alba TaxID=702742 RepID=A0ABW2AB34_9MICO
MSDTLQGKRAVVTGAASGIGLAVAQRLAHDGCSVIAVDLTGPPLAGLAASHPEIRIEACDLGLPEQIHQLVERVNDVDILVNNAGIQRVHPVEEFPEDEWNTMVAIMLTAPYLLTKLCLPGMYERGWGRVINVASAHGLVASPYKSCYVACKHALVGFTKTLALEAGGRCPDVTTHAICPSYVRTPLVERQIADQARAHGVTESEVLERVMLSSNAVRRLIEPEEVAEAVRYVCRDGAWSMSGSALTLDAGWLAH